MRTLLAVLALGVAAVLPASGTEGSIDKVIESEMPASGVPGLAYAVVTDGEVSVGRCTRRCQARGDGRSRRTRPFVIGSISKSFTALAVMQLVEAGKVDLDAEVSQYLDVFSGKPAGAITIRQLLSHTSGFSTLQGNTSHTDTDGGEDGLRARWTGWRT